MPGTARKPRTTTPTKRAPRKAATVAVPVDTEDPSLSIPDADGASVQPVDEGNAPKAFVGADSGICGACWPQGWPVRHDNAECEHGRWSRTRDEMEAEDNRATIDAEVNRIRNESDAEIEAALAAWRARGTE